MPLCSSRSPRIFPTAKVRTGSTADERDADRRLVADLRVQRIAFGASDDRVLALVSGRHVLDLDRAAEMHFVGTALALDDDLRVADHRFELHDAAFDERLLLFRVFVFRVFGDVAELFGLADAVVHLFAMNGFELFELSL